MMMHSGIIFYYLRKDYGIGSTNIDYSRILPNPLHTNVLVIEGITQYSLLAIERLTMIEVYSFWEHRAKFPELYVTEEENEKYNYDGRKTS